MKSFLLIGCLLTAIVSNSQTKWQVQRLSNKVDTLTSDLSQLAQLLNGLSETNLTVEKDNLTLLYLVIVYKRKVDSLEKRITDLELRALKWPPIQNVYPSHPNWFYDTLKPVPGDMIISTQPDPGELDTLQCVRIVTDEQPSHRRQNKPYLLKLSGVYNNYVNRFIEYLNLDRTPKNKWLKVWNF